MPNRLSAATELARMLIAGGVSLDPLAKAPTVDDVRLLAKKRLPKMAFDFIDGGRTPRSPCGPTSTTSPGSRCGHVSWSTSLRRP